MEPSRIAHYHLPGLFEFIEFYRVFLPLFYKKREWFYEEAEISSIYGAPADCLWGGGRVGFGEDRPEEALALTREYGIAAHLTFSNSLLSERHLADRRCNALCERFASSPGQNGVILASDLLLDYLQSHYPSLCFVSSTTKAQTDFADFRRELARPEFCYVVPDFRHNRAVEKLGTLSPHERGKVEFLCNECCPVFCRERRACYENVSRKSLGEPCPDHICPHSGAQGYRFSEAMKNPAYIGRSDIIERYLPMGFSHFKLEGRSLGSAVVFEILLEYLAKPEYRLPLREEVYLTSALDLF